MTADNAAFARYFVLASADAVEKGPFTIEEIARAHAAGVLKDRTVVYERFASRRESMTVKELLAGRSTKGEAPYR